MQAKIAVTLLAGWCSSLFAAAAEPAIELPLDRTAYFIGELVPLAITGAEGIVKLEAVSGDGRTLLYRGQPGALWLDTSHLAPGDYSLEVNGAALVKRFTLTSVLRLSAASIQDEATPNEKSSSDEVDRTLGETGITAAIALAVSDMGRAHYLDAMARRGALLLVNPDTRPTSFLPTRNEPQELQNMSQRIILTAQANGRYPNFGGFCLGWDTTGFAIGGRKMLLTYWGWGDKTQPLRNYIQRIDRHMMDEFRRRTGMEPVSEEEYLAYIAAIERPEFGTAIDLPTKLWLEEIGKHTKPLSKEQLAPVERRLVAWSAYLMDQYHEIYGVLTGNLRRVDPSLRNTASVQVDHAAVRDGQYYPSAYKSLDFQYQSTWNDQVGGPDYVYQWLFTAGLLDMAARNSLPSFRESDSPRMRPTWISTSLAAAHDRAHYPGKFMRVAAHGLAYGQSGIGFALEGFSNLLGGMNGQTQWQNLGKTPMAEDLHSGREFLNRFANLALEGRGDHGVGILYSKSQYNRQHIVMGYGRASYLVQVALVRLGYTPRFVTEEELADHFTPPEVKALIVLGQTFPLSEEAVEGLAAYVGHGGRVLTDGNTTVKIPGAEPLGVTIPFAVPGKPHNWGVPNIIAGDNDTLQYERIHRDIAPKLAKALGDIGRGILRSEAGADAKISLLAIDGGRHAKYIVAVNDSHVRTQADWHEVRERLVPTQKSGTSSRVIYDLTDEKLLGPLAPLDCDLSSTTARVFAVLPWEIKSIVPTVELTLERECLVHVEFRDGQDGHIRAVLPFHLELIGPDGKRFGEFYRSTDRLGGFTMSIPIPAHAAASKWAVEVRSQLTGDVARLTFKMPPSIVDPPAVALGNRVVVRERPAIDKVLKGSHGAMLRVPVFDSPQAEVHQRIAQLAVQVLSRGGTKANVWQRPPLADYTLAYEITPQQQQENEKIAAGKAIGRIRRATVNSNDWFSALSGYRCAGPLILLDLTDVKGDNPLAEKLGEAGLLWPRVSPAFPGPGGAVVQGVHWAFGPQADVIVIQATDEAGLKAGVEKLANLPLDRITEPLRKVKEALWRQYYVGGRPAAPNVEPNTTHVPATTRVTMRHAPQPLRIRFGTQRPPAAKDVEPPEPFQHPVYTVPVTLEPKQFVPFAVENGQFYETSTASVLFADMRFWQAIQVRLDVKQPGRVKLTASGLFRYSERQPTSQAQWEGVLALYQKVVPHERRPMEIEIRDGEKVLGRLTPTKTETRDVPIEMLPHYAQEKPRTSTEEVVVELSGEVGLTAGRHDLLLVHHNLVDGKVANISLVRP